jgi:hypothetical protein
MRWRGRLATTALLLEQQVAWRERLYFTGTLRRETRTRLDGSEPAVLYPGAGVAWHVPVASHGSVGAVRLRAAWGTAGRTAAISQIFGGFSWLPPGTPAPPGFRRERSSELEAGADAEFFKGRLALAATVYHKRTTDLLIERAPAQYAGTPFPALTQGGEVGNKGVELAVSTSVLRRPNVSWQVGFSAWGNRNRVVQVPGPWIFFGGRSGVFQTAQVGLPLGSYWGFPIFGYGDTNGDGLLAPSEVQLGSSPAFLGTPFPTEGASLSNALTLGQRVRIAALVEYRAGQSLVNATEEFRCARSSCRAAADPTTPLGDQVGWAAWQAGSTAGWVQPASFLRLREVSITFAIPASWAGHVAASDVRLTLAGRNLATWTSYKGLDPEVNAYGPDGLAVADQFTQPQTRYWTARFDMAF